MPELSSKVLIELLTELNSKGLDEAEHKMSGFGANVMKASGVALGALTAMGAGAVAIGIDGLHAYEAQEDAIQRLQTGINNVKSANNKSIDSLLAYDSELQKSTRFADEQIASGQAMLTTFQLNQGTIKNLTPGMLDMAEAFRKTTGETVDLNQISVLFGKVMGDAPDGIDGMATALRRMGVIMTDQQKAVFKFGTEQERAATLAGIMDLNFKGFAEGGGKTTSGRLEIMNNQIGEVKEKIGQWVSQAIIPLVNTIATNVLPAFDRFIDTLQKNKDLFPIIAGVIVALILPALFGIAVAVWAAVAPLLPFYAAILAIGVAAALIQRAWQSNFMGIRDITAQVWNFIKTTVIDPMIFEFNVIKFALTVLYDVFVLIWAAIQAVMQFFSNWFNRTFHTQIEAGHSALREGLTSLSKFWAGIWTGLQNIVAGVAQGILGIVKGMVNGVIDFFNGLIRGANNLGGKVPGFIKIPEIGHLASGTDYWKGGLTWVGERGPELVNLPQGASVTPNNKLGSAGVTINMQNTITQELDMKSVFGRLGWELALR